MSTGRKLRSDNLANAVADYAGQLLSGKSLFDGPPEPLEEGFVVSVKSLCNETLGALSLREVLERNDRDTACVTARLLRKAHDDIKAEARGAASRGDKILLPLQIALSGGFFGFLALVVKGNPAVSSGPARQPQGEDAGISATVDGFLDWPAIGALVLLSLAAYLSALRIRLGRKENALHCEADCITSLIASVHPEFKRLKNGDAPEPQSS